MKKKTLSLALALALCLGLTVPAFAEESEWKLTVPGKTDAEAFTSGKTFILRDCGRIDYDMITHEELFLKDDDLQWTAKNVCVLGKGDTAVFTYTYKPQESTGQGAFSGGAISSITFQMIAWSDPDGDGVYDKRLIKERDLDNYDYEEDGYCDLLPEDQYEVLPVGTDVKNNPDAAWWYQSSWSGYVGIDEEQNYEEVRLSADRLLELFGPNTLVGIYDGGIYTSDPAEMDWFILVEGNVQPTTPVEPEKPAEVKTANPTNDKLTVNGVLADPTVYKIDGGNYFKIRDVAALLNGTEKQFSVGYDGKLKSVTATTGEGYTKLDTDLLGAPAGGNKTADPSNDTIYINGVKIDAEVYKIDGGNYFKLRDLGKALNFSVDWTREAGVMIDTSKPYTD